MTVPADVPTPITVDTPVTGRIDIRGETDTYTFDATTGDDLFFDVISLDGGECRFVNLDWAVTAPSGATVYDQSMTSCTIGDAGPLTMLETGTYTLVVDGRGDVTSDYTFEIVTVPADVPTPITVDTPVTGRIDIRGETDTYTFDATTGDDLFFDVISLDGGECRFVNLDWAVTAPSGATVYDQSMTSCTIGDAGPLTMLETGTYTLVVDGRGDVTSDYTFEITDVG